jgi:N utilization substance protein A
MLVESGVSTVEKLGAMTPEDLEAIQGIGPTMVEKIQLAVNAYYGQFEPGGEPGMTGEADAGVEAEALETAGESVETPDSVPAESDTMEEIHTSVQSPDEKGEVHES